MPGDIYENVQNSDVCNYKCKKTQISLCRRMIKCCLYIRISDISENEQVSLINVIFSKNKQTTKDYSQNDTIFVKLKNE